MYICHVESIKLDETIQLLFANLLDIYIVQSEA